MAAARNNRVIVVGAGPVGLACALNLALHDIPVIVLEAHAELFMDLRAGSFHPPTLEVLEPIGVTKKLMPMGIVVPAWQLRDRTEGVIGVFELASLLKDETPYPFRLHCEQHKLTPLLCEMLDPIAHAEVRFSARVTRVEQQADCAIVESETANGRDTLAARWVIGADGGGSIVRKSTGIKFAGFTYPERFALISAPYDLGQRGFTETAYISHPVEWCAVFHLPHLGPPGLWRFLYGCRPDETEEEALSDERVEERLQAVVPKTGRYDTVHRTIYRVHQRVAETFRRGRLLLAGDAAHLNNPLGGFGLNSGLQDAMNLTDKLIAVWRDEAGEEVLDRYVRQRRTASVEYVQESSIRNKRLLEETDPAIRRHRLEEMRRASESPALAKEIVMNPAAIAVQWPARWKSLKELVEDARKEPGKLRMGMIPGASAQIFAAGFEHAAGVQMIEVPFKGDSDGAIALAGGHIDVHVAVPVSYKSLVQAKKVRMLAVADRAPSPLYSNLPTFRDNGVDLVIGAFHGVFVPKDTPQKVIDKLAAAVGETMNNPEVQAQMDNAGAGVTYLQGEEAATFLRNQDATYRSIIERLGLSAQAGK